MAKSSNAKRNAKRKRKNQAKEESDNKNAKKSAKNNVNSSENDTSTETTTTNASTSKSSSPSVPAPNSFESIKPSLSEGVLKALSTHYKFKSMTPVQSAVIPLFLTNKDVCVQAVTGSGKTLAFLIPMVEMILRRTDLLSARQVGGLVISPTRELAKQTFDVASILCDFCSLPEPLLLVGGGSGYRPVSNDLESFTKHGSDIVIGTPGRVEDILSRFSALQMNELECLILDEADVLLDMGFEVTLTNILSKLPRMRRTGLFSATRSGTGGQGSKSAAAALRHLVVRAGLRNPVVINVAITNSNTTPKSTLPSSSSGNDNNTLDNPDGKDLPSTDTAESTSSQLKPEEQATPTSLTNYYIVSPLEEKLSRLVAFLQQHSGEKIIIFFLTCASVEYYGLALQKLFSNNSNNNNNNNGNMIELLHGKLAPKRREKAMERFRDSTDKDNTGRILFCTDVAARGLDVPDIEWTVQFDAPVDPSQYIHRVGRSARAGRTGSSLIFLSPKEESFSDFLRARKVPLAELSQEEENCSWAVQSSNCGGDDYNNNVVEEKEGVSKNESEEESEKAIAEKNEIPNILPKIRKQVLGDRDLLEKGTKAFTAYIRAYKEHQCAFIFRFASLDLGVLATSFSLLRLPKMPELKHKSGKLKKLNFTPAGPEIDIHAIKFKDKVREKARQKRLAAELAAGGKNAKQIKAEQRLAAKLQREKDRRQEQIQKGRNPNKKRGKQAQIFDEWDELAKEERLNKKLKRGKITKEQFKTLMYGDSGKTDDLDSDVDSI